MKAARTKFGELREQQDLTEQHPEGGNAEGKEGYTRGVGRDLIADYDRRLKNQAEHFDFDL
jgi:hypothetical protein